MSGKDSECACVYVRVLTAVSCLHRPVLAPVSVTITRLDTNKYVSHPLTKNTCTHTLTATQKQRSLDCDGQGNPKYEGEGESN